MAMTGVLANLSSWVSPSRCTVCPTLPPQPNSLVWFSSLFLPWCPWKPAGRWVVISEAQGTTDGDFLSSPREPQHRLLQWQGSSDPSVATRARVLLTSCLIAARSLVAQLGLGHSTAFDVSKYSILQWLTEIYLAFCFLLNYTGSLNSP